MRSIADYIHQNRGDFPETFKFSEPGDAIAGVVTRCSVVNGTSLSGEPETSLVLELEDEAGEGHSVWVKPKSDLIRKLAAALSEAKNGQRKPEVEEGDWVSIAFDHTEPAKTKGHNPRKIFAVAYKVGEPLADRPTAADLDVD